MTSSANSPDWNSFARAQASRKWRRQSAAMGSAFTRAIVDAAQVSPGMSVLDVACGTGEPAISIATLLKGTGEVTGIDISPGPLGTAKDRATQRGLSNTRFQQADVHQLPFPDNGFDLVTSRLGVMFFADLHGHCARSIACCGRVDALPCWHGVGWISRISRPRSAQS